MADIARISIKVVFVTNHMTTPKDSNKFLTSFMSSERSNVWWRHLEMWWLDKHGVVAVADGRQLKALDGEGEVVVVGVVDDEPNDKRHAYKIMVRELTHKNKNSKMSLID